MRRGAELSPGDEIELCGVAHRLLTVEARADGMVRLSVRVGKGSPVSMVWTPGKQLWRVKPAETTAG